MQAFFLSLRSTFVRKETQFTMRLSSPSLIALSFAFTAAARRGVDVPSTPTSVGPFHPQRSHILQPWGYPYGWGLDDNPLPAEDPAEVKEMKPVRRGRSEQSARSCVSRTLQKRKERRPSASQNHLSSLCSLAEVKPKKTPTVPTQNSPGWLGVMGDPDHRNWEDAIDGLE
jgi:hypothetical protein